jgi:ElaB/YqjD/DUF883 family membrane-anchored ribosome-binding protein
MATEYTATPTGMPGDLQQDERSLERRNVIRRLDEARNAVSEKTREAARYANQTVHANPWSSVGVGFATGLLVGLAIGLSLHR